MNREEFWNCIRAIDLEALSIGDEEGAVEPLIEQLALLSPDKIKGFENQLAELLYEIDTEKHYEYAGRALGTTGGDGFLYARCYVVAQGREFYDSILKDPSLMPETFDEWCESLLFVAMKAWESSGQKGEWNHHAPVSYETGQNRKAWADSEA